MRTISILFFLTLLSSCQEKGKIETPKVEQTSKLEEIRKVVNYSFSPGEVLENKDTLIVSFYVNPNSTKYKSRMHLVCDSFLLATGNLTWEYNKLKFFFKGDTTNAAHKKKMLELWVYNKQKDRGLDLAVMNYDLSETALKKRSQKFTPKYLSVARVVLNELSLEDLDGFQTTLGLIEHLGHLKTEPDFIDLVTTYAWNSDHNLDVEEYEADLESIEKLVPLMQEKGVILNRRILSKIKAAVNKS